MKVNVKFFAAFREATGVESTTMDTTANSPAELFRECAELHPGLQKYSRSLVAINDEMAAWESPLKPGDEVLYFPPVAGG